VQNGAGPSGFVSSPSENFESMTDSILVMAVRFCALRSFAETWPELQIRIMQLAREGSLPPGLRLSQTKLSRNSNQIVRGRIRQFES
jgi:hypothetical protein